MTPKAKAARAKTAKSFRPGRREDSPAEKRRAYRRDAIGRMASLESIEQLSEYLAANRVVNQRLQKALSDPDVSAAKLEVLSRLRLTSLDLVSIVRVTNNHWGQPPRSVVEVDAAKRVPALFEVPLEGWTDREGAHAAAAAGNGHGNGHTEH